MDRKHVTIKILEDGITTEYSFVLETVNRLRASLRPESRADELTIEQSKGSDDHYSRISIEGMIWDGHVKVYY